MSTRIDVRELDDESYEVTAMEGTLVTRHRVEVPPALLDDLGLFDIDGETVVRETFAIMLEREPVTAVPGEAPLDVLGDHYPYLLPELRHRLTEIPAVRILPNGRGDTDLHLRG